MDGTILYRLMVHNVNYYQRKLSESEIINLAFGWAIFGVGIFQFPLWGIWIVAQKKKLSTWDAIKETLKPHKEWGPADPEQYAEWEKFKRDAKEKRIKEAELKKHSYVKQKLFIFLGKYRY